FDGALAKYKDVGEPWIMFYFDDDARPGRSSEAARQFAEVWEFRERVEQLGIVGTYKGVRGVDGFYEKVSEHLRKLIHWLAPQVDPDKTPARLSDPTKYLRDILDKSAWIDIRGLQIGTGRTNRFPIEELYISLTTTGTERSDEPLSRDVKRGRHNADELQLARQPAVLLHEALRDDRLVVVGDPGAGKTTFLRRVAHALCQTHLGDVPGAAAERLGITDRTFPIYVRISQLAQHLQQHSHASFAPAADSAAWLPHFLEAVSVGNCWALDASFFHQQLEDGRCTVLLDGLDEAPDRVVRQGMSQLIQHLAAAYQRCRFVVTSRPAAYVGEVVLPDFAHARIEPLSDVAVEKFLTRWCEAVYPGSEDSARAHIDELLAAVRGRAEIRRMARSPVMLTALAVLHWNERRLPEQRADLYESIITWLSRSREQRSGRATADRTVVLLQELALAMQDASEGRKIQVPNHWAAEKLAGEFGAGEVTRESIARAERFLDEEEIDSGIIVGRGNELAFWHLTFQEFLAAKAIASRLEGEQHRLLFFDPDRVYLSDWREVVLLLVGALHEQGKAKVDGLIATMFSGLGESPALADQARCAGLIGAILRDLQPLNYQVCDPRYHRLLDDVMGIFDRDRSESVPVEERIAAADALGRAGDPRIDLHRDDYWANIPAGTFLMGAQKQDEQQPNYDLEAYEDESPVQEVFLDGFRIARYPITVDQYKQFMEDDGYKERRWWQAGGFADFSAPAEWEQQIEYPSRPVVGVSWWEAMAYCVWAGCHLPTEAQWERVARGTEGRKYPWGNEEPDEARINFDNNIGHLTPVGIYPLGETPEQVMDLAGNVWEWCDGGFDAYGVTAVRNPSSAVEAASRVLRGGSWFYVAGYCRAAYRFRGGPQNRVGFLGFRVAAVPLSTSSPDPEA
ncbi:MAG: NACHT domain-containing protein, partial [Planctomycetaceae bacterium]